LLNKKWLVLRSCHFKPKTLRSPLGLIRLRA